jgi:hypothetical protein
MNLLGKLVEEDLQRWVEEKKALQACGKLCGWSRLG